MCAGGSSTSQFLVDDVLTQRLHDMQLVASGLMSRRTAMERSGLILDVDEELRRIEAERVAAL